MIVTSEKQLRYIVKEYIEHYNHEHPHRGLGGKMIEPYPQDEKGEIVELTAEQIFRMELLSSSVLMACGKWNLALMKFPAKKYSPIW